MRFVMLAGASPPEPVVQLPDPVPVAHAPIAGEPMPRLALDREAGSPEAAHRTTSAISIALHPASPRESDRTRQSAQRAGPGHHAARRTLDPVPVGVASSHLVGWMGAVSPAIVTTADADDAIAGQGGS